MLKSFIIVALLFWGLIDLDESPVSSCVRLGVNL